MYIFTFFVFFMILMSCGYDLETSFSASATCVGNVGIAFGKVCPNFLIIEDGLKLLLCLEMILGRLEIVCFAVFFVAGFWQRHKIKF
jgi:trk system potassium uptake protein TrkH